MANLFDPAGKPFGWAHHAERDHIRKHLTKRHGAVQPHSWDHVHRESRVNDIQRRLHKYDETFAVRSRRRREQQEERCRREAKGAKVDFSWAELERLVEHFADANDPISAGIGAKATELLKMRYQP